MPTHEPRKCQNCGGVLGPATGTDLRCQYCGTLYTEPETEAPAPETPAEPTPALVQTPGSTPRDENEGVKNGCGFLFLFGVIILVICAVSNEKTHWANGLLAPNPTTSEQAAADSTNAAEKVQKAQNLDEDFEKARVVLTEEAKSTLRRLAIIKVDVATFRKLYSQTRKQKYEGNRYVFDKSSPIKKYAEALYLFTSSYDDYTRLGFKIKHGADKWLYIESITFTADGKKFEYQPRFSQERVKAKNWEYSDDFVSEDDLRMLISIARAKKATITLQGSKTSYTTDITPAQQAAFSNMLYIYKGLLLGYNKD